MALRPLLLSAVVGIAALGMFQAPAAKASGYISVDIGTSAPHHRSTYQPSHRSDYGHRHAPRHPPHYRPPHDGRYHRPGYTFVPGHWAYGQRGRVWVPDQYVRVPPRYQRGHYPRYDDRYDTRVIYRSAPRPTPLPGAFYDQRGGD